MVTCSLRREVGPPKKGAQKRPAPGGRGHGGRGGGGGGGGGGKCISKNTVSKAIIRARQNFKPSREDVDPKTIRSHSNRHRWINDAKTNNIPKEAAMMYSLITSESTYDKVYGKPTMEQAGEIIKESGGAQKIASEAVKPDLDGCTDHPKVAGGQPLAANDLWAAPGGQRARTSLASPWQPAAQPDWPSNGLLHRCGQCRHRAFFHNRVRMRRKGKTPAGPGIAAAIAAAVAAVVAAAVACGQPLVANRLLSLLCFRAKNTACVRDSSRS